MNLPHLEPLIFAKEVLFIENNTVEVACEFEMLPTLAMFIEAAAQATVAFNTNPSKKTIAFLTLANHIELLEKIESLKYIFKVKKEVDVAAYIKFSFEAHDSKGVKIVQGKFTLLIQE